MMKITINFRNLFLMGGSFCLLLLASAYALEFGKGLIPCPLCLLQRYVVWIMALLFFAGSFFPGKTWSKFSYLGILLFYSILGGYLSGSQIWFTYLPPEEAPPCSAEIQRLFEYFPILDALKFILASGQECAKETFMFLGLSLAEWSFMSFVLLGIFLLSILFLLWKKLIN